LPVIKAAHLTHDFVPDGRLTEPEWQQAMPVRIESQTKDVNAVPELSTAVRALWSAQFLYLSFECPFTKLSVFTPTQKEERFGLWENDVVEAFIGADPAKATHYTEYEWAPNGEQLDLIIDAPAKDFPWSSGMDSAVSIDEAAHVWRVEVRIPMRSLATVPPAAGGRWRINLYRHDKANNAFLAFSPTLNGNFHTPARFGWIEFAPPPP
jgi:Carbohydrate family 9 binding domain-like